MPYAKALQYASIAAFLRKTYEKKFISYKTASHLKKRNFYDRMPLKSEGILTYIELFEGVMAGK